ncbi:MAG TPA: glycosyltransferase family 2 protein [Terracidiphilus sp.]
MHLARIRFNGFMRERGEALFNCQKPTISVLIPAYNASAFLHRAVRSALTQSYAPLEVLIVDDASTDETLAVANELANQDPRVHILTLPTNSGPGSARNLGLAAARGDWVALLDADDAYIPSRLETLVSAQAGRGVDVVLDNFFFFDVEKETKSAALSINSAIVSVDLRQFVEQARPYSDETDWGLLKPMFRREFLERRGLRYPEFSRHGEDFLFMFEVLRSGARCVLTRNPGYLYTTRDSGMSRTIVDYGKMIEHTVDLTNDPCVRKDVILLRLLSQRIADLKRWSRRQPAELRFREARARKKYIKLAILTITDVTFASRALKLVLRSLRRSRVR